VSEIQHTSAHFESDHGQIQVHQWSNGAPGNAGPDLVLLHPMPHDGLFFGAIAPLLGSGRTVIAPDYPGYGGSDPLDGTPTIGIYAEAMMTALRSREGGLPVDLFGFHTGCLVAVEMSLRYGADVRRLVQVDVPYFDPEKRKELMASDFAVGGFIAAFSYPGEKHYPLLRHDSLVIATSSSLLEPSLAAAAVIPGGSLQKMTDVHEPALENGAEPIARSTLSFLND
jgi:pimeloyl-ACP methyl ester carboxylesterase